MSRRVRVHHFVVANLARPENQSWRAWDLFHVSHWIDLPADIEFPYTLPRLHLFSRFYLSRAKPTEFRIRVTWLHAPGGVSRLIGNFGPYTVAFAPDTTSADCSFNLHNVQLQGVGIHRVELFRQRKSGWKAGQLIRVTRTYFVVER